MTDEKTKPGAAGQPEVPSPAGVDPETVRIEEMELTEQQLRLVSGGKGLGGIGRAIRIGTQRSTTLEHEAELQKLNQTIGQ